jgi:hypothetical protein
MYQSLWEDFYGDELEWTEYYGLNTIVQALTESKMADKEIST